MNTALFNLINSTVTTNGTGDITGENLNLLLKAMVSQTMIEVTYSQLSSYITASALFPNGVYKITDRGDAGIIVQAVSTNLLSKTGIRLMKCPKKDVYEYDRHGNYIGVWRPWKGRYSMDDVIGSGFTNGYKVTNGSGTTARVAEVDMAWIFFDDLTGPGFTEGETLTEIDGTGTPTGVSGKLADKPLLAGNTYCVWGGNVWRSLTRYLGEPDGSFDNDAELDTTNWVLVPKTNADLYEVIAFGVEYDFHIDYIEAQWDGMGNYCRMPKAVRDIFGLTWNPVDMCDWNQSSETFVFTNIKTMFGFVNNCPRPNAGLNAYSNIQSGGVVRNDCAHIQNVVCNSKIEPTSSDLDVLAPIKNNKCFGISDIYQTGGIADIPIHIENYAYHTDDESCYFEHGFEEFTVSDGTTVWKNCILNRNVVLCEAVAMGVNLNGTGTPVISIELEVNHTGYLTGSMSDVGDGVKTTSISSKTTAKYRQIGFKITGGEINQGVLKVALKYL